MPNLEKVSGVLDLTDKGFGFLRSIGRGHALDPTDTYVGKHLVRKYKLLPGMFIEGEGSQKNTKQTNLALENIESIDGLDIESSINRIPFSRLTVIDPQKKFTLETGAMPLTTRVMDIFTPIGRGQRALMVSPPKAGKTTFIEDIANGIKKNSPDAHLIIFLVDERPEEVTQFKRSVGGEIVATSFDSPLGEQIRTSKMVLNRVKRLVETGKDVVMIVDSITRLGRAYNKVTDAKGRTMSGGIAANALDFPRKFFGAARNVENGGSLTIVATCLVDTGSRMDEIIFQEFKGTGNTEIVLDRSLAEERVFPALNLSQSGTRKEENLHSPEALRKVWTLMRALSNDRGFQKYKALLEKMGQTKSNADFLATIPNV